VQKSAMIGRANEIRALPLPTTELAPSKIRKGLCINELRNY
jgi:hypothetical protein